MPKKKTYKLQRVLEIRERARDDAALSLKECRDELEAQENELRRREKKVEDCRKQQKKIDKQMVENAEEGIKSSEMVKYREHLVDLRDIEKGFLELVKDQKSVVTRAESKVAKALENLREAEMEVKVIEKHRENWDKKNAEEIRRLEKKENDEIGTLMHNNRSFE